MIYSNTYINDLRLVQSAVPNIDKLNNSVVVVTGAGGLIGSAIVDFLLEINDSRHLGISIYAGMRDFEKYRMRFGDRIHRIDLKFFNYDTQKPVRLDTTVDYIIHAASPANPRVYADSPVETMLSIIQGTNGIFTFAQEHKVKNILFVSSGEIYGNGRGTEGYSEDDYGMIDILNPRACYPSAKRVAETLCAAYHKEYGIRSVIVRPGHIYGPTAVKQDNRAATSFFRDAVSGNKIVMKSPGVQKRSYCYVIDCISAIFAVLLNGKEAKAYNIAHRSLDLSIRELAGIIADTAGVGIQYIMPSNDEKAGYNLMEHSCLDASMLLETGWIPMFDTREGVRHTIDILMGL